MMTASELTLRRTRRRATGVRQCSRYTPKTCCVVAVAVLFMPQLWKLVMYTTPRLSFTSLVSLRPWGEIVQTNFVHVVGESRKASVYFAHASPIVQQRKLLAPTNSPAPSVSILTSIPSTQPSPQPSGRQTIDLSAAPSAEPTTTLSLMPSAFPSISPSANPSSNPSDNPTALPSVAPTMSALPTLTPSYRPSNSLPPSSNPTSRPSTSPSNQPTTNPSAYPSASPSDRPSNRPSASPSREPTSNPSSSPSANPTGTPSMVPSYTPSLAPSTSPTSSPSSFPSTPPTAIPSMVPSFFPSSAPSTSPTSSPSSSPSVGPTVMPSMMPSTSPSSAPSTSPSITPSSSPSLKPTATPSLMPSNSPSSAPSAHPSSNPTDEPSSSPSDQPTSSPSNSPSASPSAKPTATPSLMPSNSPSSAPSALPSSNPTDEPSSSPSDQPTSSPSNSPSASPSWQPSATPSSQPTDAPSAYPTVYPTSQPSALSSVQPSSSPSTSLSPTLKPSASPTAIVPSASPSSKPSMIPSSLPSQHPTNIPSLSIAPTNALKKSALLDFMLPYGEVLKNESIATFEETLEDFLQEELSESSDGTEFKYLNVTVVSQEVVAGDEVEVVGDEEEIESDRYLEEMSLIVSVLIDAIVSSPVTSPGDIDFQEVVTNVVTQDSARFFGELFATEAFEALNPVEQSEDSSSTLGPNDGKDNTNTAAIASSAAGVIVFGSIGLLFFVMHRRRGAGSDYMVQKDIETPSLVVDAPPLDYANYDDDDVVSSLGDNEMIIDAEKDSEVEIDDGADKWSLDHAFPLQRSEGLGLPHYQLTDSDEEFTEGENWKDATAIAADENVCEDNRSPSSRILESFEEKLPMNDEVVETTTKTQSDQPKSLMRSMLNLSCFSDNTFKEDEEQVSVKRSSLGSNSRLYEVRVGPGPLGIIVDNCQNGGTVIAQVKATSPLKHMVNVGDKIVMLDDVDTSMKSAVALGQWIMKKPYKEEQVLIVLAKEESDVEICDDMEDMSV